MENIMKNWSILLRATYYWIIICTRKKLELDNLTFPMYLEEWISCLINEFVIILKILTNGTIYDWFMHLHLKIGNNFDKY